MISERTFASSFAGFWAELLPLLTPTFVNLVNEGFKKWLTDDYGIPLEPVVKKVESHSSAVVAEFAFYLAKASFEKRTSVTEVYKIPALRASAEKMAIEMVQQYESSGGYVCNALIEMEQEEGLELAENYERFLQQRPGSGEIEFAPEIPGAGFISACKADISIEPALFEVKTVSRNLASKDIRQIVVYLALQSATGEKRWTRAGFFNPRKAQYHEFEIEDLIGPMSGGRSASEVYHDLLDFICITPIFAIRRN